MTLTQEQQKYRWLENSFGGRLLSPDREIRAIHWMSYYQITIFWSETWKSKSLHSVSLGLHGCPAQTLVSIYAFAHHNACNFAIIIIFLPLPLVFFFFLKIRSNLNTKKQKTDARTTSWMAESNKGGPLPRDTCMKMYSALLYVLKVLLSG